MAVSPTPVAQEPTADRRALLERYRAARALSVELCEPLPPEDFRIQSMPDVSPPWWNLGHTSWFFAKNILEPFGDYSPEDAELEYPLNSYYESHGDRVPRAARGLLTRPTTERIRAFRRSVDERLEALAEGADDEAWGRLAPLIEIGIQHEQQHQELLVSELKHIRGSNPPALRDAYPVAEAEGGASPPGTFVGFEGGLVEIGNLDGGWCWDNELPVHEAWLEDFELLDRLVTNREYLEFVEDGGYGNALLWLSNGWAKVQEEGWRAPLYWEGTAAERSLWTLGGVRPLDPEEPVCHVSYYEADAFARWKAETDAAWGGARMPTEREWEHAARRAGFTVEGANLLDSRLLQPRAAAAPAAGALSQLAGDLWEWTSSHFEPYPRYRPYGGALMEYNSKFMDNQRVLRGGSCATPADHIRVSYRNFWAAGTRFQFTGIRPARDAG